MMAWAVWELPGSGTWIYEIKFDGHRALTMKSGLKVQLLSRNRTSFTKNYPALIEALKKVPAKGRRTRLL